MTDNPFIKFGEWLKAAEASEPNDPNAMTVATVDATGRPAARILLMKAWDEQGFVYFGNLGSRKADNMRDNPQVALLFHWKSLQRQIRIEGRVSPVDDAQADEYFATRPRASQIGAWASQQSRPLASREVFEARLKDIEAKYVGQDVPRPAFWSGWRLTPDYFEFWQGIDFRLHDRLAFTAKDGGWNSGRLYP